MAITFVLGRSGTGKTYRCFHAIVDELRANPLGLPIYWLLPRQATFTAERELTCNSGLGGFLRARVLSFQELGREILDDCGGSPVPQVTPLGRQMILGNLLRQNESTLKFFKPVARLPGLAAKLDSTFTEFERAGKNAADLSVLLEQLNKHAERENPALLDKIHDLHLIYNRYTEYLGQDRLDQHRRLLRVLSCIDHSKLFRNATVYVDGFTEFTEYERQVLARLGKTCRHVEITLPMDPRSAILTDPHRFPEELSLFHSVEMTYRKLWFTFRQENTPVEEPPTLLRETKRFRTANLQQLERLLFDRSVVYVQNKEAAGIELLESPNRRAEVDAAARRINALLAAGYRLRDIGVLVRDLAPYHELIDVAFREHGIRYFADRRRATAHHPLPQFIRAILMLGQQLWSHEWLMTLLKSGLASMEPADADALENYALRHRIRGEQWASPVPWSFHSTGIVGPESDWSESEEADDEAGAKVAVSSSPQEDAARLDRLRRGLIRRLKPFVDACGAKRSVQEFASALFDAMERFDVRAQLAASMEQARAAGEYEQLGEHDQVWSKLVEMFEELVDVLGDEIVSIDGFHEIIESALEHFELALVPPTVDQVLVGQIDRTRLPTIKAVLVLGLNEGVFPKVQREDSVLSDTERRELHARDMAVSGGSDRRLLDENLFGYLAFTGASDLLYASRIISEDSGKAVGESIYFRKLRQMFPKARLTRLPREHRADAALITTPRQLVSGLMHWARLPETPVSEDASSGPWPALYQWLTAHACCGDRLDETRFGAWKALLYDNAAALSPTVVSKLFPAPLHAEVAQLETFAACPFRHFARHGVRLQSRHVDEGVSAMDLGNVFHEVLDQIGRELLQRKIGWSRLGDVERHALVRQATQEIGRNLRGEVLLSTARNRYLLSRIEKTLDQVLSHQKSVEERGRFQLKLPRVKFGPEGQLGAFRVPTPQGDELILRGKIDRVDVLEQRNAFVVVDYKLGGNQLRLDEVYYGLSLQLLTSLLVLKGSGEQLTDKKLTPAAAFYVRMLRTLGEVDHPSDAIGPDNPKFDLQVQPRGLLDGKYLRDFDKSLDTGASDVVCAKVRQDGSLGSKKKSDAADSSEFAALLEHVQRRLGELADGITTGNITIAPYMLRQKTPCPRCEFRGVCRFEPSMRSYRFLDGMDREAVLATVVEEGNNGG